MGIFDFQAFIRELREKLKEGTIEMSDPTLLDSITEDTEFKDLSLYKEYVSKFDIEGDFKNMGIAGLMVPDDLEEDIDFTLLFQLVASSFSSEYELGIDTETKLVNLIITAVSGEQRITKELQELWTFQILRLFEIYIQEQLNLEGVRLESEDYKEGVEMEREMKLLEYRKKMRQIKKKLMNNQQNQQEIDDVEDEIDNLMNC